MPKASELKRGMVVEINGIPHSVKTIEAKSPSSRGASTLYKIRYTNLQSGQKLDESHKSDDLLKEADCQRKEVQYSYNDGDHYVFMDLEDYSQYEINNSDLSDQAGYLSEGLSGIIALLSEEKVLGIELPQTVNLTITDTAPEIKGSTATGRTKPATLNTGIEVQVPEYLEPGEEIKIHTGTGKFISRAK
ncbi:MAG: elongation factor P-like protein YeiP [Gammaproteobacteria bacterium]|jgi:elongation factor P|nr:elongation factor P-like protein YeiP [Gammaproteobacteria bacterium]MBT4608139.1 elongation factor P-like protein YeiP [Thiotrichales bacterium]MBT3471913.1 elongation factor P-like protein YeiP [Gammaproteobacteria bacterium]MBT3966665.1 elongation factor P-like protein YeiP [Gammaproteobacteria bacterium]MBT4081884.1 elongation factor P-like protein YeiP [Gammaproteobacteria bacterium]